MNRRSRSDQKIARRKLIILLSLFLVGYTIFVGQMPPAAATDCLAWIIPPPSPGESPDQDCPAGDPVPCLVESAFFGAERVGPTIYFDGGISGRCDLEIPSISAAVYVPGSQGGGQYSCTDCTWAGASTSGWVPWPAPGQHCFSASIEIKFNGGDPSTRYYTPQRCV